MNKQKGFANIILIIFVIVIAGVVGFSLVKKLPKINQKTATTTPDTTQTELGKSSIATTTTAIKKSGIKVAVTGRYCSGARPAKPPPDYMPCGEEPLDSFLLNIKNDISGTNKQVTTDSTGKVQVELLPGKYTITGHVSQYIIGGPFSVEVKSGVFTDVQLKFQELRP